MRILLYLAYSLAYLAFSRRCFWVDACLTPVGYIKSPSRNSDEYETYVRWLSKALVLATIVATSLLGNSSGAWAAGNCGYQSISYSGVANPPTSDKPQSKLWWTTGPTRF